MDDNLYDEFGNYIGPELGSDNDSGQSQSEDEDEWERDARAPAAADPVPGKQSTALSLAGGAGRASESAIVLHEDKKYYPDAEEVYPDAETMVQDEDTQPLSQPIVAPVKPKLFSVLEREVPATTYSTEFMASLMDSPALIRNIALCGHLHHGKTALADLLIEQTHDVSWDPAKQVRYTDSRKDEQQRGVSIKSTPVSLVLQTTADKSFLINVLDTPGHTNFCDEVTAAFRVVDGVVLVVDAIEGVMMNTEKIIQHAVRERLPITLVINKLDRLILELKLPPADAYYKLMHTIEEVNGVIGAAAVDGEPQRLSPELGNVCFASSLNAWCFTLESFAKMYCQSFGPPGYRAVDYKRLAKRLWGDIYFNPETRKFESSPPSVRDEDGDEVTVQRSFIQFVLDPIYKIYAQVLGEEPDVLARTLSAIGVTLRRSELHLDPKPLLKLVMAQFLGQATGFADMVTRFVPSPVEGAVSKVDHIYSGALAGPTVDAMRACDPKGPLMINVVKLYPTPDGTSFLAFGRVFSGTVHGGDTVRVLGESYTTADEEDLAVRSVASLSISQARYRVEITRAVAGNWVLLEGVDESIVKTATITGNAVEGEVEIFKPLSFYTVSVVKLAVEPLNPAELPKVLTGLRKIQKTYPLVHTKVEESGEHVLFGTGEMQLDSVMHDLRVMFAEVEIKVADPVTAFCETTMDPSSLQCFAETPNKKNKLTVIAEPLEKGLAEDIEAGKIDFHGAPKIAGALLQSKYEWDRLAVKSLWAFGPSPSSGPNVFLDDTLPSTTDKGRVQAIRDSVVQGFQWPAARAPCVTSPSGTSSSGCSTPW